MLEDALKTLNSTLLDVSFWIGLAVVFIFFRGRFNELRSDLEELDPPVLTRSFTTRFRFQLASFTYSGLYAVVYLVLICIGSIEEVQQYLIAWIGQIEGETIGTPAWAVLAVTAVLPSLPWFQDLDKAVRDRLEDFASIPAKVRWLAHEVVGGLADEVAPSSEAEAGIFSEDVLMDVYEKLKKRFDQLKASPRIRAGRAYTSFFGRHDAFQDRLDKQFKELAEAEHGGDGGAFRRQRLDAVIGPGPPPQPSRRGGCPSR